MARIAVCGETYSQNLGDGVIAESLRWLLRQADSDADVRHVDFSAQADFNMGNYAQAAGARRIRRLHRALARFSAYRKTVVLPAWYVVKRPKLTRAWRETIRDCDLMVIGGGQLLMDNDLGFPLKVRELVRIAREMNVRVAFYACGVGKEWSRLGRRLLSNALRNEGVVWVSVRDGGSRDTLHVLLPDLRVECSVSVDPAVCAAEAYGIRADLTSAIVGLGISAPQVLNRCSSEAGKSLALQRVRQFWLQLVRLLTAERRQVVLFTNGQVDDFRFAESIIGEISQDKTVEGVSLLERAREPRTLLKQVGQFRTIVAHRLHANIVAYSLGIPSVGLIWDDKVREFGKMTGRSRFFLEPSEMLPGLVHQRLQEAIAAGVDGLRLADHKLAAVDNVRQMRRCALGSD